jgi:hypothetical protein
MKPQKKIKMAPPPPEYIFHEVSINVSGNGRRFLIFLSSMDHRYS